MDHPGSLHHQFGTGNSGSVTLDYRDIPDRRISLHERTSANKRYRNSWLRQNRIGLYCLAGLACGQDEADLYVLIGL